jgi:hypothetical protein
MIIAINLAKYCMNCTPNRILTFKRNRLLRTTFADSL